MADNVAEGVDLDLQGPAGAAQLQVMDLFDAGLADAEPRKLEQRITGDFARRHRGNVAEDMRRVGAVGIIAALPDVDIDPRKVRGVDLDAGDLLPVQVLAHRRRDEAAVAPDLA